MAEKKALIGMSGGVDSSVAAYLTMEQGFSCIGATMKLWSDVSEDAKLVADRLGIPFVHLDLAEDFRNCIVDPFVRCYEEGLTPNPCVECNRNLKFGLLLQQAEALGCSHIVTGHYARITQNLDTGRWELRKALDEGKDQSYFLYTLTQHQLEHTLFPLGDLTKAQVRQTAEVQGFLNAKKRDSQDICFIPGGDYRAFLEWYTGKQYAPGDYLDLSGKIIGRHSGAVGYTLGQRKGLGLAMGEPVYVCSKDMAENTVTVGPNEALFQNALTADSWNWIAFDELKEPVRVWAKARSRMAEQPAWVYPEENGLSRVIFDQPQRAITPGQAVVLYDGNLVVGGGTIKTAFSA